MTGYLTQRGRVDAKRYKLVIPNLEIRDIFKTQIMEYFKESVAKDGDMLGRFCEALKKGEEKKVEDTAWNPGREGGMVRIVQSRKRRRIQ